MAARGNSAVAEANGTATLQEKVRRLRLDDRMGDAKKGGSSLAWFPWMLVLLLAAAWASVGVKWYKQPPGKAGPAEAAPAEPAKAAGPAPANAAPAPNLPKSDFGRPPTEGSDAIALEGRGYIIPAHQIAISPIEVVGRITKLYVEEGKKFQTGDALAEIESTSYIAEFQEAEGNALAAEARYNELNNGSRPEEVARAKAELEEAKTQLNQYELDFERSKGLRGGSLAQREYEVAEGTFYAQKRRVEKLKNDFILIEKGPRVEKVNAARADWQAAKARRDRAKWRLDNCIIRAPVTGVILSKKAEKGSLINPVVGGVSTSLCEMADLSDIEVDLEVAERDLPKVFPGQACRVRADAFPDRVYQAYLDRVLPIANRSKGIVQVRIKIIVPPTEEQGRFLKPEMGCNVSFLGRESTEAAYKKARAEAAKPAENPMTPAPEARP